MQTKIKKVGLVVMIGMFFILACQNIPKGDLNCWVGTYKFEETLNLLDDDRYNDIFNCYYKIVIYEENGKYFANIEIDYEVPPISKIQAKVFGNEEWISLTLLKYLNSGVLSSSSKPNDVLISFRRQGSEIYTYWGAIDTIVYENTPSNQKYFEKVE